VATGLGGMQNKKGTTHFPFTAVPAMQTSAFPLRCAVNRNVSSSVIYKFVATDFKPFALCFCRRHAYVHFSVDQRKLGVALPSTVSDDFSASCWSML